MKTIIYSRVSTQGQDYNRQIDELQAYAVSHSWIVSAIFSEKISGAKKNNERLGLSRMMDYICAHQVDKVLIWELSRLGRNTIEVLKTIELLNEAKVSLFIKNYSIETLDADGKPNIMAQFLVTILAEVARMERSTIKERMDSGYIKYRAEGGMVGRKIGYRKDNNILREEYADVYRLLKKGLSIRNIAKITNHSMNTVMKCKRTLANGPLSPSAPH